MEIWEYQAFMVVLWLKKLVWGKLWGDYLMIPGYQDELIVPQELILVVVSPPVDCFNEPWDFNAEENGGVGEVRVDPTTKEFFKLLDHHH